MSIKVASLVWDRFPGAGSELLAMLALADWCNDEGGSLFPSMRRVAEKIRVSEKQARRIMHKFEAAGLLTCVANAHGGGNGVHGLSKQYRLNVTMLANMPLINGPAKATPPADGRAPMDGRGEPQKTADLGWGNLVFEDHPSHEWEGSHGCPVTPPAGGSLTVKESTIDYHHDDSSAGESVSDVLAEVLADRDGAGADLLGDLPPEPAKAKDVLPKWDGEKFTHISDARMAKWKEDFPLVDIDRELSRLAGYLQDNPNKRYKNYASFLRNCLNNKQRDAEILAKATPKGIGRQQPHQGGRYGGGSLPQHTTSGVSKL